MSQFQTLIGLAEALRANPWYVGILFVLFIEGWFFNTQINSSSKRGGILDCLAVGLIWTCLWLLLVSWFVCNSKLPLRPDEWRTVMLWAAVASCASLAPILIIRLAVGLVAEYRQGIKGLRGLREDARDMGVSD